MRLTGPAARWPWEAHQGRAEAEAGPPGYGSAACAFAFHPPSSSPFGPIGPPRQTSSVYTAGRLTPSQNTHERPSRFGVGGGEQDLLGASDHE
ncbi:hypothetical protein BT67DRAFT_444818 [Trichocladium antarcticum]|uniref:Uncharacterized protein n=1 Tax=Trichocladium antarcticum TaxID=1450529 RepID=A0AAN6UE73_9PEZI|nr:hypothetical protein BT67DRAFT_444818 [Trichocladium antarcticum]